VTTEFTAAEPTRENYWRSIILFGQNVQSYKFALGKALLGLSSGGNDLITLKDLAVPYSRHLAEHLKHSDKQGTSPSSQFLDSCRGFNRGEKSEQDLIETTVRLGFNNVIDAFHIVNGDEIPTRFFLDERRENRGIRLTTEFHQLLEGEHSDNLPQEAEARWRLVETAWDLGVSRNLLEIKFDSEGERLFVEKATRRVDVTSCRDSLNGYQRGRCFYCSATLSIVDGVYDDADVDHFFPHVLKSLDSSFHVDGVWNLVLACKVCNRAKGTKVPVMRYLEALNHRNEYFIQSHHPLRETVIRQTGDAHQNRTGFLNSAYQEAIEKLIHTWQPE